MNKKVPEACQAPFLDSPQKKLDRKLYRKVRINCFYLKIKTVKYSFNLFMKGLMCSQLYFTTFTENSNS